MLPSRKDVQAFTVIISGSHGLLFQQRRKLHCRRYDNQIQTFNAFVDGLHVLRTLY